MVTPTGHECGIPLFGPRCHAALEALSHKADRPGQGRRTHNHVGLWGFVPGPGPGAGQLE